MADSLRERKKARTRADLIRVSQRLFHEQGFSATTLDQICEEVQVVPQTLLRYFDSKHRLALAPQYDALREFSDEMAATDRPLDVLSTWRAFSIGRARQATDDPRPLQLTHRTEELRNAQHDVLVAYEELLTRWFARESGLDEDDDLDGRLLSCTLVGGEHATYRRWLDRGCEGELVGTLEAVIDRAAHALPRPTAHAKQPAR